MDKIKISKYIYQWQLHMEENIVNAIEFILEVDAGIDKAQIARELKTGDYSRKDGGPQMWLKADEAGYTQLALNAFLYCFPYNPDLDAGKGGIHSAGVNNPRNRANLIHQLRNKMQSDVVLFLSSKEGQGYTKEQVMTRLMTASEGPIAELRKTMRMPGSKHIGIVFVGDGKGNKIESIKDIPPQFYSEEEAKALPSIIKVFSSTKLDPNDPEVIRKWVTEKDRPGKVSQAQAGKNIEGAILVLSKKLAGETLIFLLEKTMVKDYKQTPAEKSVTANEKRELIKNIIHIIKKTASISKVPDSTLASLAKKIIHLGVETIRYSFDGIEVSDEPGEKFDYSKRTHQTTRYIDSGFDFKSPEAKEILYKALTDLTMDIDNAIMDNELVYVAIAASWAAMGDLEGGGKYQYEPENESSENNKVHIDLSSFSSFYNG